LGWAAGTVAVAVGMPQFLRLLRTRDTAGVSVFLWQLTFCINLIWISHGIQIRSVSMTVSNCCCCLVTCSILVLLHSTRGIAWFRLVAPGLAGAAVFIAVDLLAGSAAFGVVACLPSLLGNGGQTLAIVRSPRVTGVSLWYLLIYNVNQCLWTTWGWLIADKGTFITSLVTWVVVATSLVWWLLRRAGLKALFPLPDPGPGTQDSAAVSAGRTA
jgi:uncharacterized protein with PQ loop repeat